MKPLQLLSVLALSAVFSAPLAAADQKAASATVAHIRISGSLDEGPTADGLFGPAQENLKAKLDRIRKAKADPKVQALYLEIGDLSIGFGKLAELLKAVTDFRASGKKTFAWLEEGGTMEYLLASSCGVVGMPESGTLMLTGLRASVTFYKDTLDLLRIKAEVLKIGEYKGAVEPFTRTELSKENREQIESLLDDHYEKDLVASIAFFRMGKKWSINDVKRLIDEGPYTAKQAAAVGLIDRLAYPDGFETVMQQELNAGKLQVSRNYGQEKKDELDLSNPLALFKLFSPSKPKESKEPKIAVIYAVGAIESGKGGLSPLSGEAVGSTTMIEAIQQAEKDPTVKAIVLRVDSPGGSALASDLIWNELKRCKKPVVASMGDMAASGGYYISMAARKIYAEPGTTTGSIGVFGLKLVTGGLTGWAGLKTETIQRGRNAGVVTTERGYTDSERKAMTAIIEDVYAQFIDKAAAGRKLDRAKVLTVAGGRVWTGRQAKERGLVDELGTLDDAIAAAKKEAGIDPKKEMELLMLPKAGSFLDRLMDGEMKSPFGSAKALDELLAMPEAAKALRDVAPLLRQKDHVKAMLPYRLEVR